jgi:ATP-dependent DNA ligase
MDSQKETKDRADAPGAVRTRAIHSLPQTQERRGWHMDSPLVERGRENHTNALRLKNLNEPYNATPSRAKGWIKAKRSVSLSGDTDVFVTGHVEADQGSRLRGLVAGVSLSVFIEETGKYHEIANISGFPDDVRKDMTEIGPDGKPRLAQKYYGRVCTIDGQSISARAKRFRHARFVQWRPDKSPNECVMSQKFLDSLIL